MQPGLLLKLNRYSLQLQPETVEHHRKRFIKIFEEKPVERGDQFPATARGKKHTLASFSTQPLLGCKSKHNVVYVLSSSVLNQNRQLSKTTLDSVRQFVFVYYTA